MTSLKDEIVNSGTCLDTVVLLHSHKVKHTTVYGVVYLTCIYGAVEEFTPELRLNYSTVTPAQLQLQWNKAVQHPLPAEEAIYSQVLQTLPGATEYSHCLIQERNTAHGRSAMQPRHHQLPSTSFKRNKEQGKPIQDIYLQLTPLIP